MLEPVAGYVADGDVDALAGHIEAGMDAIGLSASAGRTPAEIARRLIEKAELRSVRLSDEAFDALKRFLAIHVPLAKRLRRLTISPVGPACRWALRWANLRPARMRSRSTDWPVEEIFYDAAFGRPLDYYTGLVFEIGVPGAERPLAGGGRFDRLLTLLGAKKPIPGVGFSVWLDRIEAARGGTIDRRAPPPRFAWSLSARKRGRDRSRRWQAACRSSPAKRGRGSAEGGGGRTAFATSAPAERGSRRRT